MTEGACEVVQFVFKAARKRHIKKYMDEVVKPRLFALEAEWWEAEEAKHPQMASHSFSQLASTAGADCNRQLRAWTQLRLQRHITLPGGDVKAMCPLCESASGASLSHLVRDCPAAGRISVGIILQWSPLTTRQVPRQSK